MVTDGEYRGRQDELTEGEGSTVGSTSALRIARQYADAISAKDFATATGLFAAGIVWHQPGDNRFSGTHRGAAAIGKMFGGMMTVAGAATLDLETKLYRSRLPSVGRSSVDAHEGRGDQSGHFGR